MSRYLTGALIVMSLAFLWSVRSGAAADQRAKDAEARADSIDAVRLQVEEKARADSVALVEVRTAAALTEARLDRERAEARRRASQAAQRADSAASQVRAALEAAGASTEQLDRLQEAHGVEVTMLTRQIAQADSVAAVRLTLIQATEQALSSERASHAAADAQIAALKDQITALNSGRHRERLTSGLVVAGVLGALILR